MPPERCNHGTAGAPVVRSLVAQPQLLNAGVFFCSGGGGRFHQTTSCSRRAVSYRSGNCHRCCQQRLHSVPRERGDRCFTLTLPCSPRCSAKGARGKPARRRRAENRTVFSSESGRSPGNACRQRDSSLVTALGPKSQRQGWEAGSDPPSGFVCCPVRQALRSSCEQCASCIPCAVLVGNRSLQALEVQSQCLTPRLF